uniref:regucalcin-like n=1 Tax=Callospermophilus lateralis TaxID=76772 RepID=UPI004038B975
MGLRKYGSPGDSGDPVGCVALRREGSYVVASGTCLGLLDWEKGQVEWAAWLDQDKPHNRFNGGKLDPAGRFVAGTMPEASAPGVWEPGQGSLYTLYADCSVVRQLDQLGIPNGLDWSLDHHTLYHVDGLDYSVRSYDYDVQTGGLGTRLCTPEVPVSRVTSCCFGGADYSDLYMTSAADSLSPEQLLWEPQAGHVFKVLGLGVRGLASCHFSG